MTKPKIRIQGFEEDWKSVELNTIAEKVVAKNSASAIDEVFTNSASQGIVSQRDYFNHDIARQENIKGYYIVEDDDFVYNPRVSVTAPVGPISRNKLGRSGVMSPLYTVFKSHDSNKAFLEYYFKTALWHSYMRFNGNTGARFDRFSISNTDFFAMPVPHPCSEEQIAIADTLESVDTLISKSQDKLNSLKSLKICYLNRLFPIGGGKIPPIRLEGFSGEWEVKTLADCFTERVERSSEGELLSVTINSGVLKFSDLNRHDNSSSDKSNYKVVRKGDIVYNSMRMWQGASGCSDYDGIVSPAYTVLIPTENIDPHFFAFFFKNPELIQKFRIHSQGLTSDTWNLKYPAFSKISICYPKDLNEQRKIADLFKEITELINLHTIELDKLKQLKQSCLESMFVNP